MLVLALISQILPAAITPSWLRADEPVIRTIWPQGWAFFADSADTETIRVYDVTPGNIASSSAVVASMSARNTWGLGRIAQAQLDQASYLAARIPDKNWRNCSDPVSPACMAKDHVVVLDNGFRPALLCGTLLFVRSPLLTVPGQKADQSTAEAEARLRC
jgi:antimicrobial peptide system SdpA family protein